MTELPAAFLTRMKSRLGEEEFARFLAVYGEPPVKGLRVNTLKLSAEEFFGLSRFALGGRVPWEPDGFYIDEEKPGGDLCHFAGLFYVQEPSAMCAAPLLGVERGERVLDLCAAPGGKATKLAASMKGEGILVANEPDFGRAEILSQNLERFGVKNTVVTRARPDALAREFGEYFDKILVDAPCSGEGMFKKEKNAVPEWSEANVLRCAARQREILDEGAKMLAGGGKLVYSTCTFSEEENERQVESFLARHPEFSLAEMKKLLPHEARGEGHFAALLKKEDGVRKSLRGLRQDRRAGARKSLEAYGEFAADFFAGTIPQADAVGDRIFSLPQELPEAVMRLSPLRIGWELGVCDGRFKPSHALAMGLKKEEAKRALSLGDEQAERYLHGETLSSDLSDGYCLVCWGEFPLGLGKIVNGAVKNHLPKGLRKFSR